MTTDRTSLRSLARALGTTHSALSQRIHAGTLTAGIKLDRRGRAVVVDPDAAAEEFRRVHTPGHHELMRSPPRAAAAVPAPPPVATSVWTWEELRGHSDAQGLILRALVAEALERMQPAELIARAKARMPAALYGHGDDAEVQADAEVELAALIDEVIDPFGERTEGLDEP